MPAIILKSKFVLPNKVKYSSYVNYMSRSNAVYKDGDFDYLQYKDFNEYMDDSNKTSGLFTKYNDYLNNSEKEELKNSFNKAQDNDSVLWQDVFSFDNTWLKENNFLDIDNNPDVQLIQEATRKAMEKLYKEEKLESTGIWSAAIHVNTDNIHVHVATVEKNNTRQRKIYSTKDGEETLGFKATRKPLTLDHMKSSFINTFTNRDKNLEKISSFRNEMYTEFTLSEKLNKHNKENSFYMKQAKKVLKKLPDDKRKWNYKNISPEAKNEIQKTIKQYKVNNPIYNEFSDYVNQESMYMKTLYGKTSRDTKDYANNKEEDLNYRLGNKYLKELKKNSKELKLATATNYKIGSNFNKNNMRYKQKKSSFYISKKSIRQMIEGLGSGIKEQSDLMEFEKVKREQENLNQNQDMER